MIIKKLLEKIKQNEKKIEPEIKEKIGKADREIRINRLKEFQFKKQSALSPKEEAEKRLKERYWKMAQKENWTKEYFEKRIMTGIYSYSSDPKWLREYFQEKGRIELRHELSLEKEFLRGMEGQVSLPIKRKI